MSYGTGGSWNDCKYAILVPVKGLIESVGRGRVINFMRQNTYFLGDIELPEGSIILSSEKDLPKNAGRKAGKADIRLVKTETDGEFDAIKQARVVREFLDEGNFHSINPGSNEISSLANRLNLPHTEEAHAGTWSNLLETGLAETISYWLDNETKPIEAKIRRVVPPEYAAKVKGRFYQVAKQHESEQMRQKILCEIAMRCKSANFFDYCRTLSKQPMAGNEIKFTPPDLTKERLEWLLERMPEDVPTKWVKPLAVELAAMPIKDFHGRDQREFYSQVFNAPWPGPKAVQNQA